MMTNEFAAESQYNKVCPAGSSRTPTPTTGIQHITVGADIPSPTLADIIRVIKSVSAHRCAGLKWQRSYYEHIIRSERDYLEIWNYIDGNPSKWADDKYYIEI